MKVTYYGHAALLIETNSGVSLLVDPFITDNKHAQGFVTADDFSPDVLLLTHAHFDHWGDSPSIIARAKPQVIGALEVVSYVQRELGHDDVFGMNSGGSHSFPWGRATFTYARHSSSFPDGTYGGIAGGFILHVDDMCVYIAGDTCRFAEMAWIGDHHDIDVCFLPIGDTFTMGPDEAVEAAKMLKPKLTIPVHFDTFPPIEVDVRAWSASMESAGLASRVLSAGDVLSL